MLSLDNIVKSQKDYIVAYHGTKSGFKDFDIKKAFKDGLYGPGHYFTSSPAIAGVYSSSLDAGKFIKDEDGFLLKQKEVFFKDQEKADRFLTKLMSTNRGLEHFDKINLSKAGEQLSLKYASSIKGAGPNIRKVILDLKNPFNMDNHYSREAVSNIASFFGEHKDAIIKNILGNQQTVSGAGIYEHLVGYEGKYPYTVSKTNMNDILQKAGFDSIKHKGGGIGGVYVDHDVHIAFKDSQIKPFWGNAEESMVKSSNIINSVMNTQLHNSGTVAVNEIKTITTGAARLTNRPAIEATMNIASNAVKSAGGLTGKGSTYKILSKVLK